MKRCPTCHKTFADQNLVFCVDDGTPLVLVEVPDDEVTVVSPTSGASESAGPSSASSESPAPAYQPPGSYRPPGSPPGATRRTWPWILGIVALLLLLFAGLGIAAAFLIPKIVSTTSNRNTSNFNANVERRNTNNSNQDLSNSNSDEVNENSNEGLGEKETTSPPTDEAEVLADLTDLEHEWTVANINADKKKLDRILADDYVGTVDGQPQGKAEYLRTIRRDTTIQKWDFEDLKATLKGDRVSLTGTIKLVINDQQGRPQDAAYRFTDKFVWRDGRWQATGSEVTPIR